MSDKDKDNNLLDELGLIPGAGVDAWEKALKEKLNLTIPDMIGAITDWLRSNAEKVSQEFFNIVPNGDYGFLIEEPNEVAEYLRTEATKLEHWDLAEARIRDDMISLVFDCKVVDEGDTFKGFIFITRNGKIKHAFAQNQD